MNDLSQAIDFAKSGDKGKAKQILAEVLQREPDNEQAWLSLSGIVDDPNQKIYCLEKALKINPDNRSASAELSRLKNLGHQTATPADTPKPVGKPPSNFGHKLQPLPDHSSLRDYFTGWGIWPEPELASANSSRSLHDPELGLLIYESKIASNRIFKWGTIHMAIALILGVVAIFIGDVSSSVVIGGIAFIFVCAALYEASVWYLNQDLKIKIFREGFNLTKGGKSWKVFWKDIATVKENWSKTVYQGVIHVYTHNIDVVKFDGQAVGMDRRLDKIEEVGYYIQSAVSEFLLPNVIEQLKSGDTCDFGAFSISREGITHKGNKFLSWGEAKSLQVQKYGHTTVSIYSVNGKLGLPWASENGASISNQKMFLELADWFINVSKQAGFENVDVIPVNPDQTSDGSEHYNLLITKNEARDGCQKIFYIGYSKQERKLVVKIPAGIQSGTVYKFVDYGQPSSKGGAAGVLNVEVIVNKGTSLKDRLDGIQMMAGIILLIIGMMWLSLWSTLDLLISLGLAGLIGGIGGVLISIRQRWLGLICGVIGGVISFILQTIYYILMYVLFERESFWNYETAIVMFVSFLPGIGLYMLFTRKKPKKQQ